MARCERYTRGEGGGREDTERLIENSQRCSVTKDETCNNRGICSFFSSCSFTTNCLAPNATIGLGCKCACPRPSPPPHPLDPSLRESSRLPTGPDLAIATRCNPHRRRCVGGVSLSPVLEFRSCSCGIVLVSGRTWTNARLLCAASNYMVVQNHRWRLPSLSRWRAFRQHQRSRFEISLKMLDLR